MLKTLLFPSESSQRQSTQTLICIASLTSAKLPVADWLSRDVQPAPVKTTLWFHLHIGEKNQSDESEVELCLLCNKIVSLSQKM